MALWQVLPVRRCCALVLFAFALGPGPAALRRAAPGLFWLAVLFSTVLATQRSFAIESGEGTRDGLRLSGIDPAGVFLGKAAAVAVQLAVLQVVLWAGVTVLFGVHFARLWLAVVASAAGHGRAWRPPASSTGRSRPACGSARPCCPLLVLPDRWRPVLLAGVAGLGGGPHRRGRPRASRGCGSSGPSPPSTWRVGIVLYGPLQETA